MIALFAALVLVTGGDDELADRIEEAAADGVDAVELEALADQAFERALGAGERSAFWGAMTLVARLCEAGPPLDVRPLRERALALLVERETDSLRWSALVTAAFIPPLVRLERELWAEELRVYDQQLQRVAVDATTESSRDELAFARAAWCVRVDRSWDFLTTAERERACALLVRLEHDGGGRRVPGGRPDETVGGRARRVRAELTELAFGAPAPRTSGVDLDGEPLDVDGLRGRIVVLDFWTTFCQPCLALVPHARDLLERLDGEPVVYVGVNGDPERELGAATARRVGMPWRNLWDGPSGTDGPAATAWYVAEVGWPSVFVLDTEGRIRGKLRGREQVERELEPLLHALVSELRAGD